MVKINEQESVSNVAEYSKLVEIFDMIDKAHTELAKCNLPQFEYAPISLALIDAKKRLSNWFRG